jgi:monovalent cation/hydrogen antiporter
VLLGANPRLRLPRRLLTRVRAEATVLPLVLLPLILAAISAGVAESFVLGEATVAYVYDVLGGVAIGAVIGLLGVSTRRRTADGPPQIAVSFAIPFLASLAGYAADASSVSAVIAAGFVIEAFYSGRLAGRPYSPGTQELGRAFWEQTTLLLAGGLAFVVGLSIPTAVEDVDVAAGPIAAYVAGALTMVTALRFAVAYATAGHGRDADRVPRAKEAAVLAWGAGRTPLAFVVALLVPAAVASGEPFPNRELILVFTAALVVSSALLQGTTIAALVRALGLAGDEGEQREDAAARAIVAAAGKGVSAPGTSATAVDAKRAALVTLYDADEIGEETLLRLRAKIDVEAQRARIEAGPYQA